MRFVVLSDNLTDGPQGSYLELDLDDPAVAARAVRLEQAGAVELDDSAEPAKSANKAAWVEWAVAQGADRTEAEAATKDSLIEEHGSPA